MPELPEVEVVKRGLEVLTKDRPQLLRIELRRPDLRDPMPATALQSWQGARFIQAERRAKYLLLGLAHDGANVTGGLLSHLGMSGTWRLEQSAENCDRIHDHVLLHFSNNQIMVYNDPRRFGVLDVWNLHTLHSHARLAHLGPEPWDPEFTPEVLFAKSRKSRTPAKVFLMDQGLVVGVGNIYASEAFFQAKVRPQRQAGRLRKEDCLQLHLAVLKVLESAIQAGGSSLKDFYSFGGLKGGFQDSHFVYDRAGELCRICNTTVRQIVLGGRSSFYCPKCQV